MCGVFDVCRGCGVGGRGVNWVGSTWDDWLGLARERASERERERASKLAI